MSAMDLVDRKSINLSAMPAEVQSADLADVISTSFQSTMDNFRVNSESALIKEHTERRDKKFKELTGKDIYESAGAFLQDVHKYRNPKTGLLKTESPEVQEAVNKLIAEMGVDVPNRDKIVSLAEEQARDSLAKQQQAMAGATDANQIIGGLAGSFGALMFDPLNVATLPFGAGASRSILKTIAIEAGLNMAAEAVSQPFVAEWQNQIGNKYGFSDALENVGMAGLFGAAIPAAGRGLKLGIEGTGRLASTGQELFLNLKEKFKRVDLPEQAMASEYMSRVAHIEETNLSRLNDSIDYGTHERAMKEVNSAINEGRIPDAEKMGIRDDDVSGMKAEKAEVGMRDTVKRYADPIDDVSVRPRGSKEVDEIFTYDKPQPASVERQREIEELYNSPEAIRNEEEEFKGLMEKESGRAVEFAPGDDGKTMQAQKRLEDIDMEIKADKEYLNAIRTCSI